MKQATVFYVDAAPQETGKKAGKNVAPKASTSSPQPAKTASAASSQPAKTASAASPQPAKTATPKVAVKTVSPQAAKKTSPSSPATPKKQDFLNFPKDFAQGMTLDNEPDWPFSVSNTDGKEVTSASLTAAQIAQMRIAGKHFKNGGVDQSYARSVKLQNEDIELSDF